MKLRNCLAVLKPLSSDSTLGRAEIEGIAGLTGQEGLRLIEPEIIDLHLCFARFL